MFESDGDRLALITGVGGEQFETGQGKLWAIFDREYQAVQNGEYTVESRHPVLHCRTSDVELHKLTKDSAIVRVADETTWLVKRFEDDGTGITVVELRA